MSVATRAVRSAVIRKSRSAYNRRAGCRLALIRKPHYAYKTSRQGNRIWNFLDSLTESASTKCHLGVAKMRSWWPVEPPRSPRRQGPGGPTRYQPLPIPAFLGALASWRFTPGPRRKPQDDANSKCDCPGVLAGMLMAPAVFRNVGIAGTVALCGTAILLIGMTGMLRLGATRVAPT